MQPSEFRDPALDHDRNLLVVIGIIWARVAVWLLRTRAPDTETTA